MNGYAHAIEQAFDNAEYLAGKIRNSKNFSLVIDPPEYLNVCFWYAPPGIKEQHQKLHELTAQIKAQMQHRGKTMVAYQPMGGKPNFFKLVTISPYVTHNDLDFVLKEIEEIGQELLAHS